MGIYWFNKPIDKSLISKFAIYDKTKKKFVVKEEVKGIPIKRELLKSFAKTPDHYLRTSDQNAMEITDKIRKLRDVFFPSTLLQRIYKGLVSHLRANLNKEF
jgi:hypothetical protein